MFTVMSGTVSRFRTGVPRHYWRGAVCVGDIWLQVDLNSFMHDRTVSASIDIEQENVERSICVLEALANVRATAVVGARPLDNGLMELHWLLSAHGNLMPQSRLDLLKRSGKILWRWGAWATLMLCVALWGAFHLMQSGLYVVLMIISLFLLVVSGIGVVIGLLIMRDAITDRWRVRSASALRQQLETPASMRYANNIATHRTQSVARHSLFAERKVAEDLSEQPHLWCIQGAAHGVRMEVVRAGTVKYGRSFKCFRFSLNGEAYTLFAASNALVDVLLAEGDRVEVVVAASDQSASERPCLVWAMRNLEDDRVYACHGIMSPIAAGLIGPVDYSGRMTGATPLVIRRGGRLCFEGFIFCGAVWLLMNGIGLLETGKFDEPMLTMTMPLLLLAWLCAFLLPYLWSLRRQRGLSVHASRLNAHQKLTKQVYSLLGIDPPTAWPLASIEI